MAVSKPADKPAPRDLDDVNRQAAEAAVAAAEPSNGGKPADAKTEPAPKS